MTEATLTLTDFLLARIAEDEAVARAAVDRWHLPSWRLDAMGVYTVGGHGMDAVVNYVDHDEAAPHIVRHDPARVLAECKAKRRIVAAVAENQERYERYGEPTGDLGDDVLAALATVYADHPDYGVVSTTLS